MGVDDLPGFDAIYDHAPCALLVTATSGMILRTNRTFCEWVGYDAEQLIGQRRLQELLSVGGRIFHQTHWMPLLEMQGSIAELKIDFKRPDGSTVSMVLNAVRRRHQGAEFDIICAFVMADRNRFEEELLIAKRQAEQTLAEHLALQRELSVADARLRIALESAQLYVWDLDPKTRERRYDNGVALLLGLDNPLVVSEALYANFIDPADRDAEAQAFAIAVDGTGGEYRCVYRLNGADGVQRTVLSTGRGVFDSDNQLLRFVGVIHDISEVSLQRALAEDRALFAEQMMGIVSHDLRNPLQVISMASERLGSSQMPSKQSILVAHVRDAGLRAQRLVNDLLDFTQARLGQGIAVTPTRIELHETLASCVAALRIAYPDHAIGFDAQGNREGYADADRLTQLIGNLVSNAIAYGNSSAPVTLTTSTADEGFTISVHNYGAPIPTEKIEFMFAPMTRGDDLEHGTRSVGLGLFIVSEITKAHHGQITVSSNADTGTTFTAHFPGLRIGD
jgi:sigma-B regulation protein RsbU (phosphoserine phosphatase)